MSREYFCCDICNTSLNSLHQLVQHEQGKTHINQMALRNGDSVSQDKTITNDNSVADPKPYGGRFVKPGCETSSAKIEYNDQHTYPEPVSVENLGQQPVDPVRKAIEDNFLGRFPMKRQAQSEECEVCKMTFNSREQARAHYSGAKHAKKKRSNELEITQLVITPTQSNIVPKAFEENFIEVEGVEENLCKLCGIPFTSKLQAEAHYKGAKHKKKLKAMDINQHMSSVMTEEAEGIQKKGLEYVCIHCDAPLNSPMQIEAHIQGRKHKIKVNTAKNETIKKGDTSVCT